MRGFMEATMSGAQGTAVEFLTRSLEILDWGQVLWKDVLESQKGIIFSKTFIRGVRALHGQIISRVRSLIYYCLHF